MSRKKHYKKRKKNKVTGLAVFLGLIVFLIAVFCCFLVYIVVIDKDKNLIPDDNPILQTVHLKSLEKIKEEETQEEITEEEPEEITSMMLFNKPEFETVGPSSIELGWIKSEDTGYIIKYRKKEYSDIHGKKKRENGSLSMSEICTCFFESDDSPEEDINHGWHTIYSEKASVKIEGLQSDSEYDIHVYYNTDEKKECIPLTTYKTASSGFGDPFRNIDAFLIISERDEEGKVLRQKESADIKMSSSIGCLNAKVKPVMDSGLYSDVNLSAVSDEIKKGENAFIVKNSREEYCYRNEKGIWLVYIRTDSLKEGWIEAGKLMIDSKYLFTPDNELYSVRVNRTNAESSVFTAGGNAWMVDGYSELDSRYDVLMQEGFSPFERIEGYNFIENVTGEKLPNYGSSKEMPIIWDLAMELIQCEKNALQNGYVLLLYDGYRPQSASQRVYENLGGSGILSLEINDKNLAKGFLQSGNYDYTYYISKYSRHNQGTAIDLSLFKFESLEKTYGEVEMQTKMHTLDFRGNMLYNNWEADLLSDIMMGHGSNLECLGVKSEWWHFQLKKGRTDLYPFIDKYGYCDFEF